MYYCRRGGGIEGNQQRDIEEVRPNVVHAFENNFFQGNEEMRGPGAANSNNFNNRNGRMENREINAPQASSMPQETFNGAMERRNVAGNQQRERSGEQEWEVNENELAQEMDNQQSARVNEDIDAPQAPLIPQETSSGVLPAPSLSATPNDTDQGDDLSIRDNQMNMLSDDREIGRQAVEHDENDNGLGAYANQVQCTDDLENEPTQITSELMGNLKTFTIFAQYE